jgi:FkbM family methyltransferase
MILLTSSFIGEGIHMSLLRTIRFITNHPLNREHRAKSVIRFAKWQVGSRLVPGAIVYEWVNGSKFLVKAGEAGLTGNIYCGLHEFPEMAFLLHFLRDDDLFVDVGANVGAYTILACSAVGARGYAFEPVPSTYSRLVENMRLNHLDEKVKCINKGVGAQQGEIAFTSDRDTTNRVLATGEHADNRVIVEVTSLDTVLYIESPVLMKIDVEGYEALVLEGGQQTLKKRTLQSVIMELNEGGRRYGFDESRTLEVMFDNGFRTYLYDPLDRTLLKLEGKNLDSDNTLFIRDRSFVVERLRTSPKVSIHGKQF